jgi:hypothetical protein
MRALGVCHNAGSLTSENQKAAQLKPCALHLQQVSDSLLEPFTSTWPSCKNISKEGGTK